MLFVLSLRIMAQRVSCHPSHLRGDPTIDRANRLAEQGVERVIMGWSIDPTEIKEAKRVLKTARGIEPTGTVLHARRVRRRAT